MPDRAPVSKQRIHLIIAVVSCHFVVDCYGGVFPIFKYLGDVDLRVAGIIAAAAMFAGSLSQPFFGVFADHGHRRLLLLAGPIAASATMFLGTLSLGRAETGYSGLQYGAIFFVVLVSALGAGMFHPVGFSMAGNSHASRRATMVGAFVAAGMLGFSVSQGMFSMVFHALGGHTEWMFIPAGCVVGFAIVATRRGLEDTRGNATMRALVQAVVAVRKPLAPLYVFQTLMSALGFSFVFLMPEFLELRGCPRWFIEGGGYFFWIIGTAVMVVPIGHLSDRRGARGIMVACALAGTVTYGLIVGVAEMPLWLYAVLLFVSGGAIGSTNPIAIAIGQRLAPASASIISGIRMGLAWAVASLSVGLTGYLASLQPVGVLGTLTCLGGLGILGTITALFVRD
jgi:FSR family fosmidomycin resistance protein-like MFS transporter